jgi:hypothetical protein
VDVENMKYEANGWRYNSGTGCIEFIIKVEGQEDLIVEVPETKFGEIVDTLPSLEEEKEIQKLLKLIYEVKEKRVMTIAEIDKKLEELREKHSKLRERMSGATEKFQIMEMCAESKDLGTEKVLLDTKRHLIRMMAIDESDLRAKLAKIRTGRGG